MKAHVSFWIGIDEQTAEIDINRGPAAQSP